MRRMLLVVPIVLAAAVGSTACATKKFVRTNVDEVNKKVDSVSKSVEETQERTRQNETRIRQVDDRVSGVDQKADSAGRSAGMAQDSADRAMARADDVDKSTKRLIYEVVISEAQGNFQFGKADLPEEARGQLDKLIETLKANPQGAYIEIEGHTDSVGTNEVNQRVGLKRAEAVKIYLYEHHKVPLHRMSVISYGEEKPVAPNDTRDGRAQNRRVVIKVLT